MVSKVNVSLDLLWSSDKQSSRDRFYWSQLIDFIQSNIDDVLNIYWPTIVALIVLYIPIFLLSILNRSISKLSKWSLTLPTVFYLLFLPTCLPVRAIPFFSTCVGSIGIYYAQKVCEWILIRRNEFNQWSFLDIQHELFHYRVYTYPVSVKKLEKDKKHVFFKGPIHHQQHYLTIIFLLMNIIKYYLLLDLSVFITSAAFSSKFYDQYYRQFVLVRIIVNQLSGCNVYLLFTINYELIRCILCLLFNRPLEFMPDMFRQPYLATSPSDFWSRWHHMYRYTWIELIFKPMNHFLDRFLPKAPKCFAQGVSSVAVFIFSGCIHEYFVYVSFHRFTGDQITFFAIHGIAVIIEAILKHFIRPYRIPKSIGFLVTFIFNGLTAGFFMKPWLVYFNQKQTLKYSFVNCFSKQFPLFIE